MRRDYQCKSFINISNCAKVSKFYDLYWAAQIVRTSRLRSLWTYKGRSRGVNSIPLGHTFSNERGHDRSLLLKHCAPSCPATLTKIIKIHKVYGKPRIPVHTDRQRDRHTKTHSQKNLLCAKLKIFVHILFSSLTQVHCQHPVLNL